MNEPKFKQIVIIFKSFYEKIGVSQISDQLCSKGKIDIDIISLLFTLRQKKFTSKIFYITDKNNYSTPARTIIESHKKFIFRNEDCKWFDLSDNEYSKDLDNMKILVFYCAQ